MTKLVRNAFMRVSNIVYRVERLQRSKIFLVRDETGDLTTMSVKDWELGCNSGRIAMVGRPDGGLTETERAQKLSELRDMPGNVRASALQKEFFVQAFARPQSFYQENFPEFPPDRRPTPNKGRKLLEPFARLVNEAFVRRHAVELGTIFAKPGATARKRSQKEQNKSLVPAHFLRPPSCSAYCGWLTQWQDTATRNGGQPDIRLVASRYQDRGRSTRLMSPAVLKILDATVNGVWLHQSRPRKTVVHVAMERKVAAHNRRDPGEPLRMPSVRQMNRYMCETVSKEDEIRYRFGEEEAQRLFGSVGNGPVTSAILERVEVDHVRADVEVLDDTGTIKLGRPWVTTALDHYSRLPIGVHVHFDGPCLTAVMQALRDVMRPKAYLAELLPGTRIDYPVHGRPDAFFFDRGSDFDSEHVREVSARFGITVEYEPVKCPHWKGAIERWHRTMHQNVEHPLPGATPSRFSRGSGRDPEGRAYVTVSEYRARLWRWIATVYAKEVHRGIRAIPMSRWKASAAECVPSALPSEDELRTLLNRIELRKASREGIRWQGLRWRGPALDRDPQSAGIRRLAEGEGAVR